MGRQLEAEYGLLEDDEETVEETSRSLYVLLKILYHWTLKQSHTPPPTTVCSVWHNFAIYRPTMFCNFRNLGLAISLLLHELQR